MAIQWFALHISLWCCPLRIWRATCWRWGSSAGVVRGCKEPWSGPAAPWLVSLKPSVPPPRPVRPHRVPSPHPQSPPCWERTRLRTEPFYNRDEETAWLRGFTYGTTCYQRKMWSKRKIKNDPPASLTLFERREFPRSCKFLSLHIHKNKKDSVIHLFHPFT